MKINHFTELDCWKKGRELTLTIYKYTKNERFKKDFGLRDQIQRAVISIIANIAEGFGSQSSREFIRFLSISLRSIYETQSHLQIAYDLGYISECELNKANDLATDCINLCKGLNCAP
jgi:four helix bundle protein